MAHLSLNRGWYLLIVGMTVVVGVALLLVLAVSTFQALQKRPVGEDLSAADLAARAVVQSRSQDYAGAERSLQEALLKDAQLEYTSQLAVVKFNLAKYEESVALYQQVIDARGEMAFAWNGMGNAYRDWAQEDEVNRLDRQNRALEAYRKSRETERGFVAAYQNEALLLSEMGRRAEAADLADEGYRATGRSELAELATRLKN